MIGGAAVRAATLAVVAIGIDLVTDGSGAFVTDDLVDLAERVGLTWICLAGQASSDPVAGGAGAGSVGAGSVDPDAAARPSGAAVDEGDVGPEPLAGEPFRVAVVGSGLGEAEVTDVVVANLGRLVVDVLDEAVARLGCRGSDAPR